jgi:hypothetical protein
VPLSGVPETESAISTARSRHTAAPWKNSVRARLSPRCCGRINPPSQKNGRPVINSLYRFVIVTPFTHSEQTVISAH